MYTTVEAVTKGHPDKVCDQISDAIVDAYLTQDPLSRVAVNCMGSHGLLVIGGEVTSTGHVNHTDIARSVYKEIGYHDPLEIIERIVPQSPDIAMGVDTGGAGDQGIMYGYATHETPDMLPSPIVLVQAIARSLAEKRTALPWLKPDGKAQVTYKNGQLETVLVSCQHDEKIDAKEIEKDVRTHILSPLIADITGVRVLINPTGRFVQGGFQADTGLTGRKIIADTYGGLAPHGGGAFSGKDPSKVDRSAAYMARYVARHLIRTGKCSRALVRVAYAIGIAEPVMIDVDSDAKENLEAYIRGHFDFTPKGIIEKLTLRQPIYQQVASGCHFGNPSYPWERD